MSKKCPLCGDSKADNSLFCLDCTEKLNNEYEVDVPASEKTEEVIEPNIDNNEEDNADSNSEEREEELFQSEIEEQTTERNIKILPAPSFDKKAWRKQREDKRSDSEKSYYELSKEGKKKGVLAKVFVFIFLIGAILVGLYIYNSDVKSDNLERSKWELAERANTVDAYLDYMNEYPQGKFSDEAYKSMLTLKNRETEAWENLKISENTIEFTDFLKQYPQSPYQRMVKDRLDSLVWKTSVNENSIEGYTDYIDRTNSNEILGTYIGEAKKRFKMLDQSTPIDGGDLEQIRVAVEGFFVALSTQSEAALSEYIAPVMVRYKDNRNLQSKELLAHLRLEAANENALLLRLEAEATKLQYERMLNDTFEVNIPMQKVFEDSGGGISQIKGYIAHLKLDSNFKIYSFHETKPYSEAP